MAIIDIFPFYNELDILTIRLEVLNDYVDKFVICEATETFSGKPKPLYFKENEERFAKWKDKIIHYVVKNDDKEIHDKAMASPNTGNKEHWWLREFSHKEEAIKALSFCKDDDIICISDVDEIWNPALFPTVKDEEVYRPTLTAYYYFLNNRSDHVEGSTEGRISTFKTFKKYGANHIRTEREVKSIKIPNGGWHFCNIGDEEFIKSKLEAYGHQEWNTPNIKCNIKGKIFMNEDFAGRGFKLWLDESGLPDYLIKNKEKWKALFR
jgi:beta-1,4-mannosyl-glycoprotein beta-1,4-N-acetylglucosaminyltransferase